MVSNIDKYYQDHIIYDSKRELAGRRGGGVVRKMIVSIMSHKESCQNIKVHRNAHVN